MATALVHGGLAADVDMSAAGYKVKVLGKSGKFTVTSTDAGDSDPNKVQVEMDSISEKDASGNTIANTGAEKHSFNSFATQDFTFLPAEEVVVGDTNATKVTFSTPINSIGQLRVDTFIMTEEGTVGPDEDQWEVNPGDLKWNIAFDSWEFCSGVKVGSCKAGDTGAFIDLDITVKGSAASATKVPGKNNSYALGGGRTLMLTREVILDGQKAQMPEGYPKLEVKGSKQIFTFRFPRFKTNAIYDPVIGNEDSESTDPTTGPTKDSTTGASTKVSNKGGDLSGSVACSLAGVTMLIITAMSV